MSAAPRFWLVNADAASSDRWAKLIRQQGWEVHTAPDVDSFLAVVLADTVGLAMIDNSCLDSAGAEHLGRIKGKARGVSILLTSGESLDNDRIIRFLEAGADDYFPQSLAAELLLAKLKAHLRRILPDIAREMDVLKAPAGDLRLDRAKREVLLRDRAGKWTANTSLTDTEIQLLALFLKRPGAALERRFIIDSLWQGEGEHIQPGTVDKHVESLRRKLGAVGPRIQTIYGVGYAYREPSAPAGARSPGRGAGRGKRRAG